MESNTAGIGTSTDPKPLTDKAAGPALVLPTLDAPKIYGPTISPDIRSSKTMPTCDWSEAPQFIPRALVESINLATRYNGAILSAWDLVRASHADLSAVRWQRFPSVTTGFSRYSTGSFANYPTVTVNMPLVTFGRIGSQLSRAKALQLAAIATWRQKLLEIAGQTEQAYFQVISATRRERILNQGVKEHFRLVESMARRVAMSVSPHADLLLGQSRLQQIQNDLEVARAQRETAMSNLAELLQGHGQKLGDVPVFDPKQLDIDWIGATDEAIEYSPAREQALAQADAARDQAWAARASVFPELDAQYSYDPIYGSRVGLAVKLQAAGGLSQFSQVTAAQSRFDAALAQVRDIERQVRQAIEGQRVANGSAKVQASITGDVAATANEVSESYERQFIAGHRSWLDVMNAVRELINTQLAQVTVETTAVETATQLELGTGRWQPAITEDESK
jgi:adhesin transport system outer membrane protein